MNISPGAAQSLAVAIIARDEERHIEAAIASVADLADEVVALIDDRTSDATAAICRACGARVLLEPWRGFPAQRNYALASCNADWVLFLDADERVTLELAGEIRALLATAPEAAGFWIPRYNLFFGRRLYGGGWYPDRQLRLLRRGRARYDESRLVHEYAELDGAAGTLQSHLVHLNIEQFAELWRKQRAYAVQEAQTLYLAGVRPRRRNLIGAPAREFYRRFVQLHGYRDGALGMFLCATLAFFELVKYLHLMGLSRVRISPGDGR